MNGCCWLSLCRTTYDVRRTGITGTACCTTAVSSCCLALLLLVAFLLSSGSRLHLPGLHCSQISSNQFPPRISFPVTMATSSEEYLQDGPEARRIAAVTPYYPFHGVPRFYDISGIVQNPEVFQLSIDVFARRYAALNIDCIAGLDARGFIFGPPLALALKKPFVMLRKKGKLPNAITGAEYRKEYVGASATGGDELCMSKTSIRPGMRVLVIDDLVATGGTLIAACDLLEAAGAVIVECACIVELKALGGFAKLNEKHPNTKVWGLISEDILTLEGQEL